MSGTTDDARPLLDRRRAEPAQHPAAAQAAFAEHGLDASLEDVAEEAGVGIATLYRRFPSRAELISACFGNRLEEYVRAADAALEDPDAWRGFCGFLERICEMQAADRGLADVLTRSLPMARNLDADRTRGDQSSVKLIAKSRPRVARAAIPCPRTGSAPTANAGWNRRPATPTHAWPAITRLPARRPAGRRRDAPHATPDPRQVMRAMRRLEHPRQTPTDDSIVARSRGRLSPCGAGLAS